MSPPCIAEPLAIYLGVNRTSMHMRSISPSFLGMGGFRYLAMRTGSPQSLNRWRNDSALR